MKSNGTPPPGSSSEKNMNNEDEQMEDVEESFDGEDMIEVIYDDDDNDDTDLGDLADDEGDEDFEGEGPGMNGFTGQQPDYILTAHNESAVFCCSFDNVGMKLITGGEDDAAYVWDNSSIKSQAPIFKCKSHKDSVVSCSFSWDSVYFSSCDLSGVVKVWKTISFENIVSFETGDLSWSFWHFATNVLFAGCEDGSIYMWKIPSGECKIYSGSTSKCESAVLLPDGRRLLAGYADGTIKMFDLKTGEVEQNFTKSLTEPSPVLCVAAHPTHNVIAVGSSDGTVKLFSTLSGKLVNTLQCSLPRLPKENEQGEESSDSVESVAFCSDPQLDLLACGTVMGNMVVWDVTTLTERLRLQQDAGLTKLIWDPKSPVIYTGGLDGVVRAIDARTCKVEKLFGRHRTEVLDVAVAKDGAKLVSVSEDGSVFVYLLK